MHPQSTLSMKAERTEQIPAQERETTVREADSTLPAEQVYAQRLAECSLNGEIPALNFIP